MDENQLKKLRSSSTELERLAASSDGQAVKAILKRSGAENALERGDAEALKKAMADIIGTEEGARLCGRLSELMK